MSEEENTKGSGSAEAPDATHSDTGLAASNDGDGERDEENNAGGSEVDGGDDDGDDDDNSTGAVSESGEDKAAATEGSNGDDDDDEDEDDEDDEDDDGEDDDDEDDDEDDDGYARQELGLSSLVTGKFVSLSYLIQLYLRAFQEFNMYSECVSSQNASRNTRS
jgi:hypothetical protein